jgi:hypothetical protein
MDIAAYLKESGLAQVELAGLFSDVVGWRGNKSHISRWVHKRHQMSPSTRRLWEMFVEQCPPSAARSRLEMQ